MLTIKEIARLYREGVSVIINKKRKRSGMGTFDGDSLEVRINSMNIPSHYDKNLTILHEFVHARDDMKSARNYGKNPHHKSEIELDEEVENEAVQTYWKCPYVLKFIKQLYKINLEINKK